MLEKLLNQFDKFSVVATKFSLDKYPTWYAVKKPSIKVTFVKDTKYKGVLYNEDCTEITIYHNGSLTTTLDNDLDKKSPHYCKYNFYKRNYIDMTDEELKEEKHHIKILFFDFIFEDYIHRGDGIIIKDDDLSKLYSEYY